MRLATVIHGVQHINGIYILEEGELVATLYKNIHITEDPEEVIRQLDPPAQRVGVSELAAETRKRQGRE